MEWSKCCQGLGGSRWTIWQSIEVDNEGTATQNIWRVCVVWAFDATRTFNGGGFARSDERCKPR
jgi:hypothetical protein